MTVRKRMEALGWFLAVCDDSLAASWMKTRADGVVVEYAPCPDFDRDREACQREAEAAGELVNT